MGHALKEACREITKQLFERKAVNDKKDAEEFESFLKIWVREIESINNDLHWKNNR